MPVSDDNVQVVSVIPVQQCDELDAAGSVLDRSRSWCIKTAIAEWIDRQPKQRKGRK